MRVLLVSILLFINAYSSFAQEDIASSHIVSMNTGSLLFQLIPFKSNSVRTGPYDFNYMYKRGSRSFVFGLGINTVTQSFNFDNVGYNLRLGFRKSSVLSDRWSYFRGIDVMRSSRGFNRPIDAGSLYSTTGIGVPLGIEYHFHENISVWTESIFYLSVSHESQFGEFAPVQIIPPLSIHFSAKL